MHGTESVECQGDGTWSGETPQCYPAIAVVIVVSVAFALELFCFGAYYIKVTMNKPPPLHSTTFIPDDTLGKFTSEAVWGVLDEEEDDGSEKRPKKVFRHVLLCTCCRLADTWHSVGLVPYFAGVWLPQVALPCLPCIAAYLRGQIRARFLIKGSLARDVMLWIFCIPCVATQEAKHVDHMCDVAEEEAEVMRRAEERKLDRERRYKEAKEAEQAAGGGIASKIGKDGDGAKSLALRTHNDMIRNGSISVMDIIDAI